MAHESQQPSLISILVDSGCPADRARALSNALDEGKWGNISSRRLACLILAYAERSVRSGAVGYTLRSPTLTPIAGVQLHLFGSTPVGR